MTWVNVDGLGDLETLTRIQEIFGLHRLALEDVVNVHQRPKAELYEDHLFVVARMPRPGAGLETEQFSLFLGKGYVLTFQEAPGDCLEAVRERIRNERPRIRAGGPDYLAYAIIDAVIDSYFPLLEGIGDQLEALEEEVLARPHSSQVPILHGIKRDLMNLRRIVWPLREVLAGFVREESPLITEATKIYLRDCYDHTIQIMDLLESYRDVATGLMDLYLSSISNRMNEVMKVLTIIATIFIPLGFIAGLYGMNFNPEISRWNMPELNWALGYPFALGVMGTIALVMLVFFGKKGWLR